MTAVEHIIAWIESSRPHYDRLLKLEIDRKNPRASYNMIAGYAWSIAVDAYREMISGGDAWASDHSPATILQAAIALTEWELEQ